MLGFIVSTQLAYGSAVMPGEEDTIYCQLCIDKVIKKSDNKAFNLKGFDFSGNDMRKYPDWINWVPAENEIREVKSALETKIEKDTGTSHGLSRDHIFFKVLMKAEEGEAIEKINLEKIRNDDFYKSDNFHTIYLYEQEKSTETLNQEILIQSQRAEDVLQNILSIRNDRY
ncbi:hypothetical protein [Nitrosopumilus sp. S4]